MVAALNAAYSEGPEPPEVIEVTLMERFGWTQQELDAQDWPRLWRSLTASAIYRAAQKEIRREPLSNAERALFYRALDYDYAARMQ